MSAIRRNFGAQGGFQEAQVIVLGRVQPGRGRDYRMIGDGDWKRSPSFVKQRFPGPLALGQGRKQALIEVTPGDPAGSQSRPVSRGEHPGGAVRRRSAPPAGSGGERQSPLAAAHTVAKLPAQNLHRARRFYRDRLGLEPVEEREGGLRYVCGTTELHIFASSGAASGRSTAVPDNHPSKGRGERGAFFFDSEGNLLALGQATP